MTPFLEMKSPVGGPRRFFIFCLLEYPQEVQPAGLPWMLGSKVALDGCTKVRGGQVIDQSKLLALGFAMQGHLGFCDLYWTCLQWKNCKAWRPAWVTCTGKECHGKYKFHKSHNTLPSSKLCAISMTRIKIIHGKKSVLSHFFPPCPSRCLEEVPGDPESNSHLSWQNDPICSWVPTSFAWFQILFSWKVLPKWFPCIPESKVTLDSGSKETEVQGIDQSKKNSLDQSLGLQLVQTSHPRSPWSIDFEVAYILVVKIFDVFETVSEVEYTFDFLFSLSVNLHILGRC